jgi:hypothetical protein
MSHSEPFCQWRESVSNAFPKLSRPQANVLALWSDGMVLAKSCGITLVCATLAVQLGCSEANAYGNGAMQAKTNEAASAEHWK